MKKTQFKIKQVPQILENLSQTSQSAEEESTNIEKEQVQEQKEDKELVQNDIPLQPQTGLEVDSSSNQVDAANSTIEYHAFTRIPKHLALCDLDNNVAISDQDIEQLMKNQSISITEQEHAYMESLVEALMMK